MNEDLNPFRETGLPKSTTEIAEIRGRIVARPLRFSNSKARPMLGGLKNQAAGPWRIDKKKEFSTMKIDEWNHLEPGVTLRFPYSGRAFSLTEKVIENKHVVFRATCITSPTRDKVTLHFNPILEVVPVGSVIVPQREVKA